MQIEGKAQVPNFTCDDVASVRSRCGVRELEVRGGRGSTSSCVKRKEGGRMDVGCGYEASVDGGK